MKERPEWIEVDPFGKAGLPRFPCLVTDGPKDIIQLAHDASEYYESKYWYPMPDFPLTYYAIASNEALDALLRGMRHEKEKNS